MIRRRKPLRRTPLKRKQYPSKSRRSNHAAWRANQVFMTNPRADCAAKGLIPNSECFGHIDSEHIVNRRIKASGGCDLCKVNRAWLCRKHHSEAHVDRRGGKKFWYNQHPELAARYNAAWEHEYARRRGELPCSPRRLW